MYPLNIQFMSADERTHGFIKSLQTLTNRFGVAVQAHARDFWTVDKRLQFPRLQVEYLASGGVLDFRISEAANPPDLPPAHPVAEILGKVLAKGYHRFTRLEDAVSDLTALDHENSDEQYLLMVAGREHFIVETADAPTLHAAGACLLRVGWNQERGGLAPILSSYAPDSTPPLPDFQPDPAAFLAHLSDASWHWGVLLRGAGATFERPGFVYRFDGRTLDYAPIWGCTLPDLEYAHGSFGVALADQFRLSEVFRDERLILCTEGRFAVVTPEQERWFPSAAVWEVLWLEDTPPLLRSYL